MENQVEQPARQEKIDYFNVASGVWGLKIVFVNIYMVSNEPHSKDWVLVDAGLQGSSKKIIRMAEDLFGDNNPPSAIVLTHGHFDHTGSLKELLKYWQVPVYAHRLEMPYLTGKSSYPPPDPSVGGGLMSSLSWAFPKGPINLGRHISILPGDSTVPVLQAWKYYHTPGHAPGHISLFRESDRTLLVGDAFVTTKQESAFAAIMQTKQLSGPPKYFTNDWIAAEKSVQLLAGLDPMVAATGHGVPISGEELHRDLKSLAEDFKKRAVPVQGRYIDDPAIMDAKGVKYIPPKPFDPMLGASVFGLAALSAYTLYNRLQKRTKTT